MLLRNFRLVLALAVVTIAVAVGAPSASAQSGDAPEVRIGVVDVQRIMRESKAGKSLQEQLGAVSRGYREDIGRKEKELSDAREELKRQRALLSADAFSRKRDEFEARVAEVQRATQERKRELERANARAQAELDKAFLTVLGGLAKERGLTMVVPRRTLILVDDRMDVTDEVIKRLDEQVPEVKLSVPGE